MLAFALDTPEAGDIVSPFLIYTARALPFCTWVLIGFFHRPTAEVRSMAKRAIRINARDIDFSSASVLEGTETMEAAGQRLYDLILQIASGAVTKVETINHVDPFAIYYEDPIF